MKDYSRKRSDRTGTRLYRLISFFMSSIPWSCVQLLGKVLGIIGWISASSRRKHVITSLETKCGMSGTKAFRASFNTFVCFGRSLCELFAIPGLSASEIKSLMPLKGTENLRESLSASGAILFTGHFGSWELLGASISAHGIPMMTIVKRQSNRSFDRWLIRQRHNLGMKTVYRGRSIRPLVKWLKKGGMVSILMDQDAGDHGVFVPFFGEMASTPAGAATLSLRLGVPVLPLYSFRRKDGTHLGIIGKPLKSRQLQNRRRSNDDETAELCAAMNRVLESIVRKRPFQWLWLHRRFKTKPPGFIYADPQSMAIQKGDQK